MGRRRALLSPHAENHSVALGAERGRAHRCYHGGSMSDAWLDEEEPAAESGEELVYGYWLRVGARELELESGETLIGRGDECHVAICEAMVSRKHARVVIGDGRPYIEDLGSANGTFVNQSRIQGRTELCPGDRIFIGTSEIELTRR